jgi:hypothetical protein
MKEQMLFDSRLKPDIVLICQQKNCAAPLKDGSAMESAVARSRFPAGAMAAA